MDTADFSHVPIMVPEVISLLKPERGGIFVDGTLGGGGHSEQIAKLLPEGSRLIGIDRDKAAIDAARNRLGNGITIIKDNFFNMKSALQNLGIKGVDGILLDLGVSSYQLDNAQRGFSYNYDAPLDMRMDQYASFSAYDVVNGYTEEELIRILFEYGEEKFSRRIASKIISARVLKPIERTGELAELIKSAIPAAARREGPHPAKRSFQAIRIEVNSELRGLDKAIEDAVELLNLRGRITVISFHSLEDRIIKNAFRKLANPCTCSPKAPICTCGKIASVKDLTRKPITPSEEELVLNPRSRSAKLRAAEKVTAED